jgi:hypothetical protein
MLVDDTLEESRTGERVDTIEHRKRRGGEPLQLLRAIRTPQQGIRAPDCFDATLRVSVGGFVERRPGEIGGVRHMAGVPIGVGRREQ